ncbi:class I SAM-dependent methyltransferase [Paracholeplasma vituli]|uniref:class I SAM-dependent methyltransferase n=1 Tax=Paracholeplasma vituli TaxID=69473 RepID=UPI00358FF5BC
MTDSGVFSRHNFDFGSKTMVELFKPHEGAKSFLDLGCGYGPIGTIVKKTFPFLEVTLSDVNPRAVQLAKQNLLKNDVSATVIESDGFNQIQSLFDVILLNPPIRAGKQTVFTLYLESEKHLLNDGELWIVIQKKQGAESSIKYLKTLFKKVDIIDKNKGYFVIRNKK